MGQPVDYILRADELGKLTHQDPHDLLRHFEAQEWIEMSGNYPGIPPHKVKAYLSDKGFEYTFRSIAHVNLKGGVGKTITSITAATRAVQYGFKTCILDMDSQSSASWAFGIVPEEDDPLFCDVWQQPQDMVIGSLQQIADFLYILPSSLENGLLDVQLMHPGSQKHAVRGVCEVLRAHGFDLVMIDCPPSLGTAVISTICAADTIVIPVCGDTFSLKGLQLTLNEIESICDTFALPHPAIHILYTKFDRRLKVSRKAFQRLSTTYRDWLVPIPIRTSSEYTNLLEEHKTIFASARKSPARKDYDQYVRYLLELDQVGQTGGNS